jgi:hypothetical protein
MSLGGNGKRRARTKKAQTKVTLIFNALSDDKSLGLFRLAASGHEGYNGAALKSTSQLTRKQFYSRMETLKKAGLLKKKKGRYFLTSLGKIINELEMNIENVVKVEWKLRGLDSILAGDGGSIPKEEYSKLVDGLLVDNPEIKSLLLK